MYFEKQAYNLKLIALYSEFLYIREEKSCCMVKELEEKISTLSDYIIITYFIELNSLCSSD